MGCWNGTCAISNLPVYAGDPVYVFLLVQPPTYGQHNYDIDDRCHSTTWWAPLPIHFQGEYNDYGAVEECTGKLIPLLLETIRRNLVEFEQGDNECHDISVKRDNLDIELLFEADHENRLFVNDSWIRPRKAAHIIVHKSIVDGITKKYNIDTFDGTFSYSDLLNSAVAFGKHLIKQTAITHKVGLDVSSSLLMATLGEQKTLFSRRYWHAKSHCPIDSVEATIASLIENDKHAILDEYMRHLALWMFLRSFMEAKRTVWVPPCGDGSQCDETAPHELLATLTRQLVKKQKRKYDE